MTLLAMLAMALAACTAGASPAPSAAQATPTPAASVAPSSSPSALALTAAVAFDGGACTYTGPSVVPRGARLTILLTNTPAALKASAGSALVVLPVRDGTTWAQIVEYNKAQPASKIPDWARYPGSGFFMREPDLGELQILYPSDARNGGSITVPMIRHAYYVGCHTPPEETDRAYPSVLLQTMED